MDTLMLFLTLLLKQFWTLWLKLTLHLHLHLHLHLLLLLKLKLKLKQKQKVTLPLPLPRTRLRARLACGQRGAVLVSVLMLMMAVMIVGFSSVRAALGDAQSARYERDRQVALRAAEAALLDAERELDTTPATSPRFAAIEGAGFVAGCGKLGTDQHGLCTRVAPPSWQVIDLASDDAALVPYGSFSLRALPGVAQQPRYLIELIALTPPTPAAGRFYRITALGFGQRASTRVVLQSFYRKATAPGGSPPTPTPTLPALPATPTSPTTPAPSTTPTTPLTVLPTTWPEHRIGWREISNWPALHAAVH
ncbi:MAG: PilX N-terminal domain-containing pilus assembly protein [Pseudomonadota bacterium]|nr:PilX N-terminal domain-containing pilus assembly protein [Pseudomonadota bacterium]